MLPAGEPVATPRPLEDGAGGVVEDNIARTAPKLIRDDDELEEMTQRLVDSWIGQFCTRAGELLEDEGKFFSAAAFYERCVVLTKGGRFGIIAESEALSNLGIALKRGGRLYEALMMYDASLAITNTTVTRANRMKLIREMKHWRGTAEEHTFSAPRKFYEPSLCGSSDRVAAWESATVDRIHARVPVWGSDVAPLTNTEKAAAEATAAGDEGDNALGGESGEARDATSDVHI